MAEEQKKSGKSPVEKFKSEVGQTGFIGAVVGLVVLVGASLAFFFNYNQQQQNEEAQNEIFQAQYYYENDNLDYALNGDGRNLGFVQIIDIYSGTEVANLAHFYAGAAYLKLREFQNAVDYLEDFSTEEQIVMARAQKLLGDAYMELGNFADAATSYNKAASTVDDQFFSPSYLMSASLALERGGDLQGAMTALDKIINDYSDASAEVLEARKHKARLEILAGR